MDPIQGFLARSCHKVKVKPTQLTFLLVMLLLPCEKMVSYALIAMPWASAWEDLAKAQPGIRQHKLQECVATFPFNLA